jgi:hypothetical protein
MWRSQKTFLLWGATLVLLACIAIGIRTRFFLALWSDYILRAPRLDMPRLLDLGSQERGTVAQVSFMVANEGTSELLLDGFASSCSCQVIEQQEQDKVLRVERLRIAPRGKAELIVRVGVQGVPGSEFRNTISFQSNDPDWPDVVIPVVVRKVEGGIWATPSIAEFGRVIVGHEASMVVELRDDAPAPRGVRRVTVTGGDKNFQARFFPAAAKNNEPGDRAYLGKIEVRLRGREAGPLSGDLEIFLSDEQRPPDRVRLVAEVVPLVEAVPPKIILPRTSTKGPLFSAECLCQTNDGTPLKLALTKGSADLSVSMSAIAGKPDRKLIHINCKQVASGPTPQVYNLHFQAHAGDAPCLVDIPIQVERLDTQ